ncbi:MAG: hypothetical protein J6Q92_05050 [Oscillospiraceae bacterium]|nr:hypothetical protein [Oscillospiraceae bacterium]
MPRLIDANALLPNGVFYVNGSDPMTSLDELLKRIAEAPTVDAVPVVRCKGCKHSGLYEDGTVFCKLHSERGEHEERHGSYSVWMEPDDFCSYGERRTDNENNS